MVELEEKVDAFIIRESRCALINLTEKHNQICQVQLSFLKRLLGQDVERWSYTRGTIFVVIAYLSQGKYRNHSELSKAGFSVTLVDELIQSHRSFS